MDGGIGEDRRARGRRRKGRAKGSWEKLKEKFSSRNEGEFFSPTHKSTHTESTYKETRVRTLFFLSFFFPFAVIFRPVLPCGSWLKERWWWWWWASGRRQQTFQTERKLKRKEFWEKFSFHKYVLMFHEFNVDFTFSALISLLSTRKVRYKDQRKYKMGK